MCSSKEGPSAYCCMVITWEYITKSVVIYSECSVWGISNLYWKNQDLSVFVKDINSFNLVWTLKTLMFSRLLTCDSNNLIFTFYAANYVTETCIVFTCEYTGSVARVMSTQ